ncbi:MAG: ATP-binding protein [Gemmatimonadetes bacterium]|nr:ATP-binding protein [Gemmatimonadota bacterium]
MNLIRRPHEIGAIRTALDHPGPGLIQVTGPRGVGKTTLVREAVRGIQAVAHRVPPLPEPSQLLELTAQVDRETGPRESPPDTPTWDGVFDHLARLAAERALVLVLDDAHWLSESRSRAGQALARVLASAREGPVPFHVILVGRAGGLPPVALPGRPPLGRPPEEPPTPLEVRVPPLPLRGAIPFLPGGTPEDRIRAYAVFGGVPAHLLRLDPDATLWTNVRRTFFEAGAPFNERGLDLLERDVQSPARYAAILATLSAGEADWGIVHGGVPDLTKSGQVAPYLHKLEELGLLETRRSLDATPRSRNRRYRIVDPLLAFWFRFVLPFLHGAREPDVAHWMAETVRPHLDRHVASIFPEICRRHMALDAMEWAGANARECGGLWGSDYDIDAAGILSSGATFYGKAPWGEQPAGPEILSDLDAMIAETRYGFGRESRLRIVFSAQGFAPELARQAARRHDVALVDGEALVGGED